MKSGSCIGLMSLLALLALASAASAECAWVLWAQERINIPPRPLSVEWAAPVAFVDRAACMEWIDRNARQWEKNEGPGQSVTRGPGDMAAEFRTQSSGGLGSGITNSLFCLPDTVDPRGPKGK